MTLRLLLVLSLTLLGGCLRLRWDSVSRNEPVPTAAIETIRAERAGLQRCLDLLGAPDLIWEYDGDGVAIAYGWRDNVEWGFTVSYAASDNTPSASFSFDDIDEDLPGAVLMFDAGLALESVDEGFLCELTIRHRRPSPPDEQRDAG